MEPNMLTLIMTRSMMTLNIMTLSIITLSMMPLSIMPPSIMILRITPYNKNDAQHDSGHHKHN